MLTPSPGAYLLTQKLCHHSPFCREQWKLKAAYGIDMTRNLMCFWHDHLADALHPLYKILGVKFRQTDYLKIDEEGGQSFNGHMQSDGLRAYRTFIERHSELDIIPVSCLSHARRKFKESRKDYPRITARLKRSKKIVPRRNLGKALAYAVAQSPHLEPCFLNGQIEFENNLTENAVRPTKLGHKNWMFIGGEHTV